MQAYTSVVERCPDTGLYAGYVPGFPGAHSQGETLEELNVNLKEVIGILLDEGPPARRRHDDQVSPPHGVRMMFDQLPHGGDRVRDPHVDEADDARMRLAQDEDKFAEVLVLRDEHSALAARQGQQLLIRCSRVEIPARQDIVPEVGQLLLQASGRRAEIKQALQAFC